MLLENFTETIWLVLRSTNWSTKCPGYSRACNVFKRRVRKQRCDLRRNSRRVGSTSTDWRVNWTGRGIMMIWNVKLVYWGQSISRRYQPVSLARAWNIFLWSARRRFSKLKIWNHPPPPTHSVSGLIIYSRYISEINYIIYRENTRKNRYVLRYWEIYNL